jgi:hypothetical protein
MLLLSITDGPGQRKKKSAGEIPKTRTHLAHEKNTPRRSELARVANGQQMQHLSRPFEFFDCLRVVDLDRRETLSLSPAAAGLRHSRAPFLKSRHGTEGRPVRGPGLQASGLSWAFVGRVPPRGFRWFLKHALKSVNAKIPNSKPGSSLPQ